MQSARRIGRAVGAGNGNILLENLLHLLILIRCDLAAGEPLLEYLEWPPVPCAEAHVVAHHAPGPEHEHHDDDHERHPGGHDPAEAGQGAPGDQAGRSDRQDEEVCGDEPIATSILQWNGESTYSANDLLDKTISTGEATARDDARAFLLAELQDGPQPTNHLKNAADAAGIAWRTVERAKSALGVRAVKTEEHWTWKLKDPPNGPYGDVGSLGDLPASNLANTAKTVTAKGSNSGNLDPHDLLAAAVTEDGPGCDRSAHADYWTEHPVTGRRICVKCHPLSSQGVT